MQGGLRARGVAYPEPAGGRGPSQVVPDLFGTPVPVTGRPMSSPTARVDLPASARSVPTARHLARAVSRAWQAPQDVGDVELLVTDLVANAVDHVGGESVQIAAGIADDRASRTPTAARCGPRRPPRAARLVRGPAGEGWGDRCRLTEETE